MKHAGPAALEAIEPLLARLRALPGLVERSPGCFYKASKAFLHFHEDPSGLHVDLKLSADDHDFTRVRAETAQERDALVALAAKAVEGARR